MTSNETIFTLAPYEGALPVTFEMTPQEVELVLGLADKVRNNRSNERVERRGLVQITHSAEDNKVVEIGFLPGVKLLYQGCSLFEESNPVKFLKTFDSKPHHIYGFYVFEKLGLIETGFHDKDPGQRAFTVFRQGRWNDDIGK